MRIIDDRSWTRKLDTNDALRLYRIRGDPLWPVWQEVTPSLNLWRDATLGVATQATVCRHLLCERTNKQLGALRVVDQHDAEVNRIAVFRLSIRAVTSAKAVHTYRRAT